MQDSTLPAVPTSNISTDQVLTDPNVLAQSTLAQQVASAQPTTQQVFDQSQLPSDRPLAAMNAMMNQVVTQPDPLNPAYPTASVKEKAPLNIEMSGEMPAGMQSVENLRTPEISPEVEKFIEEVKEEPSQFPHEVVMADQSMVQPVSGFMAKPVIVLPMTQQDFLEAKKASPETARRWLAEFTDKIRKIFGGGVIFRKDK